MPRNGKDDSPDPSNVWRSDDGKSMVYVDAPGPSDFDRKFIPYQTGITFYTKVEAKKTGKILAEMWFDLEITVDAPPEGGRMTTRLINARMSDVRVKVPLHNPP